MKYAEQISPVVVNKDCYRAFLMPEMSHLLDMNIDIAIAEVVYDTYASLTESEKEELIIQTRRRLDYRRKRGHRECIACHVDKTPDQFARSSRVSDGLNTKCKECTRKESKHE